MRKYCFSSNTKRKDLKESKGWFLRVDKLAVSDKEKKKNYLGVQRSEKSF